MKKLIVAMLLIFGFAVVTTGCIRHHRHHHKHHH